MFIIMLPEVRRLCVALADSHVIHMSLVKMSDSLFNNTQHSICPVNHSERRPTLPAKGTKSVWFSPASTYNHILETGQLLQQNHQMF